MEFPLFIGGTEILRQPFEGCSPFYSGYRYVLSQASPLDISHAIGCARQAEALTLSKRQEYLYKAAEYFTYGQADLEHAVRMTGMPIACMRTLFEQIPQIFREVPSILSNRYTHSGLGEIEEFRQGVQKIHTRQEGFCYAITPGSDPRATALVAANLLYLGIPLILRASIKDAAAPLVLRALLKSGLDPNSCSLIYLNKDDPQYDQKHYQILDACSLLWTFGPAESADPNLRYENTGLRAVIDLGASETGIGSHSLLLKALASKTEAELFQSVQFQEERRDHFTGKQVLRHQAGNCAAVSWGPFDQETRQWLSDSLSYPGLCMATRSVWLIDAASWLEEAHACLESWKVGDPLDPETRVGYIHPRELDRLQNLVKKNSLYIQCFGGKRLSERQSVPLLVAAQEALPDFFANDIPAYIVAIRNCDRFEDAIQEMNAGSCDQPRLAVSLLHGPKEIIDQVIRKIRAHTILINQPTTRLFPYYHEGNDYELLLSQGRLLIT
ncbi:MAG: aldehyde dehydrogenase family protein [Omnitrophica WOR_2 bacterium]